MSIRNLDHIISKQRAHYEFIPIGVNCDPSLYLRSRGLRQTAFPFDWAVVPMQSVIELIANDFSGFLDPESVIFLPPTKRLLISEDGSHLEISNDIITPVVCARYRILFPHDFPEAGAKVFGEVRAKYSRRIEKLEKLLRSDTEVVFVCSTAPLNDWQREQYDKASVTAAPSHLDAWQDKLGALMTRKYPDLDYAVCTLQRLAAGIEGKAARPVT